jgi:hypothetical protein
MTGGSLGSAALVVATLAAALAVAGIGRADTPPLGRVLIIGDSVATGMSWHDDAIAVMQRDLAVTWDVAVCRRLTGASCQDSATGEQPPTAIEDIDAMTSVPPIVVLVMGYNDYEDTFAASVDQTVEALLARGAQHILWLTLRASRDPYPALNAILESEAAKYPQLRLVDWNTLSASSPGWFQDDDVHLVDAGGVAMAHLVHGAVMQLVDPLRRVFSRLPELRVGRRYSFTLRAAGGTSPYRWRVASGAPPRGIHVLANGRIFGTPRTHAALRFAVRVTDADGSSLVIPLRAAAPAPH